MIIEGNLDSRYHHFLELAAQKGAKREFEILVRTCRAQGLCYREAIEVAAYNLNLPGRPS